MAVAVLVLFSLPLLLNIFYTNDRDAPLSYSAASAIVVAFAFFYLSSELYVSSTLGGAFMDLAFISTISIYPVTPLTTSLPENRQTIPNLSSTYSLLKSLLIRSLQLLCQSSFGPYAGINRALLYSFLTFCGILSWQFLLAILTPVSNGDQLSYNTARLFSFLLVGTPFLQTTTLIHQAFHPIGHDILFIREILWGRTTGLALLSWVELLAFIILSNTLLHEYLNIPKRPPETNSPKKLQFFCFALLNTLILSQPMVNFQALVAKNDLVIALFLITAISLFLRLNQLLSVPTSAKSKSTCFILILLCLIQLVNFKGLGVFAIPPSIVVLTRMCLKHSGRIQQYIYRCLSLNLTFLRPSNLPLHASLLSLTLLLFIYLSRVIHFFAFKYQFWLEAYSSFKLTHGPSDLSGHLSSTLLNGMRAFISASIDIPLLTQIGKSQSQFISLLDGFGLTRNGEEYYVGGYFGQDIAWPGAFFNITLCITAFTVLSRLINSNINICTFTRSTLLSNSLPNLISVYSLSYMLLIPFSIYWQPQVARYYMVPFMLLSLIPPLMLGHSKYAKTIK